jgi:predicted nucleic acid-binding protein
VRPWRGRAGRDNAALAEWIRRYADQPFNLTNAVSFALMRARGITRALTFDQHFRVAGFAVVE